ncbi:MAG: hypothetical protein Q7R71_00635 [bacterium]|nr:hypothetical protein [bacterium]
MVLFFTATLGVSVIAMILLLAVKRFELVSGRMVFAGTRPKLSAFFERLSLWSQKILPALARQHIERLGRAAVIKLQVTIAHSVVTFEHTLERVLHTVREKTGGISVNREPSAFLREIADHKKNLLYKKGLKKLPPRDSVQE